MEWEWKESVKKCGRWMKGRRKEGWREYVKGM